MIIRAPSRLLEAVIEDTLAHGMNRAQSLTASSLLGSSPNKSGELREVERASTCRDKEGLITPSIKAVQIRRYRCGRPRGEWFPACLPAFAHNQQVSATDGGRGQREDFFWAKRMVD
jgi:hypothetical protein